VLARVWDVVCYAPGKSTDEAWSDVDAWTVELELTSEDVPGTRLCDDAAESCPPV